MQNHCTPRLSPLLKRTIYLNCDYSFPRQTIFVQVTLQLTKDAPLLASIKGFVSMRLFFELISC